LPTATAADMVVGRDGVGRSCVGNEAEQLSWRNTTEGRCQRARSSGGGMNRRAQRAPRRCSRRARARQLHCRHLLAAAADGQRVRRTALL
jgi:hypothetical protein